jgi:hypothetical protein
MTRYTDRPDAVTALVRDTEIHKDCYVDDEVFRLEMAHLFANTWVYVGHASQVPQPGDYFATTVGVGPRALPARAALADAATGLPLAVGKAAGFDKGLE